MDFAGASIVTTTRDSRRLDLVIIPSIECVSSSVEFTRANSFSFIVLARV